jgi:hypothetical protein
MKEFEPDCDLAQLFWFRVTDDEEVVGANAAPVVSGLSGGLYDAARKSTQSREKQCDKDFHHSSLSGLRIRSC